MGKKKTPQLDSKVLFELGKAEMVQQLQIFDLQGEAGQTKKGLDNLEKSQLETYDNGKEIIADLEGILSAICDSKQDESTVSAIDVVFAEYEKQVDDTNIAAKYDIRKTKEVITNNIWEDYYANVSEYANKVGIDDTEDIFLSMLGESGYEKLSQEIDGEFAKRTSIKNKLDLSFLAIAVALEVAKGLLYPVIAEKAGYGQSFDPTERLDHNDNSIKDAQKKANDAYRDKNKEKYGTGKWMEFLYRTVPYDITAGTGAMVDVNLHAGAHRNYTLGHDPVLGWIFGTANILTDTITITPGAVMGQNTGKTAEFLKFATMRSYRVVREPKMMVTPERVPIFVLFKESYDVAREHSMNLPAALFAEGQHLKSDEFTKMGLPVPFLSTFSPELAGKLYKNNFDALCYMRDMKIIGKSAAVSLLIDTIIGLVHGLYYDPQKDGNRDLFEVRTRKILLIANTIGTSSNLIATYLSGNVKSLDIGGLLVTLTHLFRDSRFLLNVKKEFVENKLYEKIENELKELDRIEQELILYGYEHRAIYK